jgi:hypothetical protein
MQERTASLRSPAISAAETENRRLLQEFERANPTARLTAAELARAINTPTDILRRAIQSGNIGPLTDEGAPHYGPEGAPLPVVGGIPGLRTLPEAAATIGTAGLGSAPVSAKLGSLAGGLFGGMAGRQVGGTPGEITGTLAGGLAGGLAGPSTTRLASRAGIAASDAVEAQTGQRGLPGMLVGEQGGTRIGHTGYPEEAQPDPLRRFIDWMNDPSTVKEFGANRAARRQAVAQLRARQHAALEDVYSRTDLSPREQLSEATRALAGVADEVGFRPPPITEEEVGELLTRIRDYPLFQARRFKARNAQSGFLKLMNGELPGQYELGLLQDVFGAEFVKAAARQSGSAWREVGAVLGLPRTAKTILDMSWPLRQGIGVLPRHFPDVVRNIPGGVRSIFSGRFAEEWDAAARLKGGAVDIIGDDGVSRTWTIGELMDEAGLYLPRLREEVAPLAERTEEFLATQGRDTWVGRLFGPISEPFQRSFVAMGNKTRADIFESTLRSRLWNLGKPTNMEDVRGLAWLLNVATGRGDLGELNRYGALFAQGFFSPRLAAARVEHGLSPLILSTGFAGAPRSGKAALLAAQQVVALVGAGLSVLSLASLHPKLRTERNPLASAWGKIEIGYDPAHPQKETRKIDLFGGYQQYARLIALLYAAKGKSDTGEIYDRDRRKIALSFLRQKAAPNVGTILDLISGEYATGEKVDLETAAGVRTFLWNEFTPLALNDIIEAVNSDDGFNPYFVPLGGYSLLGGGVQTYGPRPETILYSMPYYEGLTPEAEKELSAYRDEVEFEYQRAQKAGAAVSMARVAEILGEQTGRAGLGRVAAMAIRGELPLNRERVQWALDHQDELPAEVLRAAVPDAILRDYLSEENFERVFGGTR